MLVYRALPQARNAHRQRNVRRRVREGVNAWAEANVGASEREDRGSDGLQRECTREEAHKCVAKLLIRTGGKRGR